MKWLYFVNSLYLYAKFIEMIIGHTSWLQLQSLIGINKHDY